MIKKNRVMAQIALLMAWFVFGTITITTGNISRISYGVTWTMVMFYEIDKLIYLLKKENDD